MMMMTPQQAPYGTWKSPITAGLIASEGIAIKELAIDHDDIYWIESRPREGGRYVIMRRDAAGGISECIPTDFYARTTVHEYGGGAFTVREGTIYFTNYKDQRLYAQVPNAKPQVLTPSEGNRYADLIVDQVRGRLICVREDHTGPGEAVNAIVAVPLHGETNGQVLVSGGDFYSSPRLSPDGQQLAYLTWNHPNMPWDGCELWVATLEPDGQVRGASRVAGSASDSVLQPEWSPDGVLHFVVESTGWWNIYRVKSNGVEALFPMEAEFGRPHWVFGMSSYAFASPTRILTCSWRDGIAQLAWLDTTAHRLSPIPSAYSDISAITVGQHVAAFLGGSPTQPLSVVRFEITTEAMTSIHAPFEVKVDDSYLSVPRAVTYETTNGRRAHAFYYGPKNRDFTAPAGELPPLLVISHGGPTSAVNTTLRYSIQFWTSRGFAVLDCNYGGSTGFGRDYRHRLNGEWGVVDVDDCCNGALYLVEQGLADRARLAIRGESAGGYSTLAAVMFRSGVFSAGASHYGLADLERFATDTHKFESRYLTSLIGPYPERKALYAQRSPIHSVDRLSCPLVLFQGDEDEIVPPSQAEMMFEAVRARGLPVAYLLLHGEQHGFRRAENIQRVLEAELYFYSRVFGFQPADQIEPIRIENL